MTPSRLQARPKNCRARWLTAMGFGAQAPNEGRGACAMANREIRHEMLGSHRPALTVIITGIFDGKWLLEIEGIAAA
jgi:hypothetical protein